MSKKINQIKSCKQNRLEFYSLKRISENLIENVGSKLFSVMNLEKYNMSYEAKKHHDMARIYLTACSLELEKMITAQRKENAR